MRVTTGIFELRADAECAAWKLQSIGLRGDQITLLVPGQAKQMNRVPLSEAEQPGEGRALGAVVGAALGAAGGFELGTLISGVIPGIGSIIAAVFLSATILGLAGAAVGATVGSVFDNAMTEGLPEDELFVYEDALR